MGSCASNVDISCTAVYCRCAAGKARPNAMAAVTQGASSYRTYDTETEPKAVYAPGRGYAVSTYCWHRIIRRFRPIIIICVIYFNKCFAAVSYCTHCALLISCMQHPTNHTCGCSNILLWRYVMHMLHARTRAYLCTVYVCALAYSEGNHVSTEPGSVTPWPP